MPTSMSRREPGKRNAIQRLAIGIASVAVLTACTSPTKSGGEDSQRVSALQVADPVYSGSSDAPLQSACSQWRLSPEQVEQFFNLSSPYPGSPYSSFYQVPCSISGSLEAEGRVWTFEINGGATATWHAGEEVRYWGCSAEACDDLVLLPTDLMQPDTSSVER